MLQVTTPAASNALATLAAVKAELSIADDVQDDALNDAILDASAAITAYCGRRLARQTVTETFALGSVAAATLACCPACLALYPVDPASPVTVTADGTALDATGYTLDAEDGLLWLTAPCGALTVAYTGGYLPPDAAPTDMPRDLQRACVELVKSYRAGQGRDPLLRSEMVQGVGSTSWQGADPANGGLPATVAGMLAPYRSLGL